MKTSYLEDISLFYYLLLYGNMPQILWGKVLTKLSKQNFFLLFRLHLVNMLLLFFSNKISQHQFFARKLSLVWEAGPFRRGSLTLLWLMNPARDSLGVLSNSCRVTNSMESTSIGSIQWAVESLAIDTGLRMEIIMSNLLKRCALSSIVSNNKLD